MKADVLLPRLSDSMEEGTILQWLKSPGDPIAVGDELVEIETDKAAMIFESDAAGVVVELVAAEGATLPIAAPRLRLSFAGGLPTPRGSVFNRRKGVSFNRP